MNKEQAIQVLIQVAHLAQKGGVLTLQDAVAVAHAINLFKEDEKEEEVKEDK